MTNQALDANRILAGVRAEVARRKDAAEAPEIEAMSPFAPSLPRPQRPEPFPIGAQPTLARLLAHNGSQFLSDAYRALLGRDPDTAGREEYLVRLRSGRRTRIDVLGSLALSAEGRRRGVRVPGLLPRYWIRLLLRVPILGALLSWLVALVRLPSIVQHLRVLQEDLAMLRSEQAAYGDRLAAAVEAAFSQAAARLRSTQAAVASIDQRLNRFHAFSQHLERMSEGERRLSEAMVGFADRFRGSSDEVRARLEVYRNTLQARAAEAPSLPVVDLACGRGELLQMLQAKGIYTLGVEIDPSSVAVCKNLGLPVEQTDLFEWLRKRPEKSVAVITAIHIIEHFPRPVLIRFLDECHRVLRKGGLLLVETPNPANLLVGACSFWLDPTHVAPLPEQLTSFLVERAGFSEVDIWPLAPRDAGIDAGHPQMDDPVKRLSAHHLFGPQDYAVLGIA